MKKRQAVVRSGGRGIVKTVDGTHTHKKTVDGICAETEWSEGLRDVKGSLCTWCTQGTLVYSVYCRQRLL